MPLRHAVRKNSSGGYYEEGFRGPKGYCDVCGLQWYEEDEMKFINGLWYCTIGPTCIDDVWEKTPGES